MDRKVHNAARGSDDTSYVMIGNGGFQTGGQFTGDITINSGGSFMMQAGNNTSFAQVGHGGVNSAGGNNSTNMNGRNGYATLSGHINITTQGDFGMYGGAHDSQAYAMVGHGGTYRIARGSSAADLQETGHHGNITLDSGGAVTFQAKPLETSAFGLSEGGQDAGSLNFAQLGHGGYRSNGDHYGAIDLEADGDINFTAGFGGWEAYRALNDNATRSRSDNYNILQTGDGNYAQLGHGGYQSILVDAANLNPTAIQGAAYLFNGNSDGVGLGFITDTSDLDPTKRITDSNITVTGTGALNLTGGNETGGQIVGMEDTFGTNQGGFTIGHAAFDGVFDTDDGTIARPVNERNLRNYAMVGHGGFGSADLEERANPDSVITGDIIVTVDGNVDLTAGTIQQFDAPSGVGGDEVSQYNQAQIGHGGQSVQTGFAGAVEVRAGTDVTLLAGNSFRDYAKIGHGGYDSGVAGTNAAATLMTGDIVVEAGTGGSVGIVTLLGGNGTNTNNSGNNQFQFAQIGHGSATSVQTVNAGITVRALTSVQMIAGFGIQDVYTQIGHGALNNGSGNFTGEIDVTAGGTVVVQSSTGGDQGAYTIVGGYSKIGHGDAGSTGAGTRTKSTGTWNGDIFVKAGTNIAVFNTFAGTAPDSAIIGHAIAGNTDPVNRSTSGSTYLASGRIDPDSGVFSANNNIFLGQSATITSSRFGTGAGELRIYMPDSGNNQIQTGAVLNQDAYDRSIPTIGSRVDEALATEFTFAFDPVSMLPSGDFLPEGVQPSHSLGDYGIFYADLTVIPGGGGGGAGQVFDPFNFLPFIDEDQFDAYERSGFIADYDGYEGQLFSFSVADAEYDDNPEAGGWFFEEMLDASFGPRQGGSGTEAAELNAERDEELTRRKNSSLRKAGAGGLSYYVFDPGTNKYSSYRVFGVPQANLPTP